MDDISLGSISTSVVLNIAPVLQAAADMRNTLIKMAADTRAQLDIVAKTMETQTAGFTKMATAQQETAAAIREMGTAARKTQGDAESLVGSMLKFSVINAAINETKKAMQAAGEASKDYAEQTMRVSRVMTAQSEVISSQLRAEVGKYNTSIQETGEGLYQLGTQIKDTNTLLSAQDTLLKVIKGTQSGARDTARALIQIYEQFPSAFKAGVSEGEKYRRIGELLATTFKGASAEMGEVANSLKYLGPIAEAAKIPLEQVAGVISALTSEGVRGRMAGTEATAFLTNILKNYDEAQRGIEKNGKVYNFDLKKTADGGVDLVATLKDIVRTANSLPVEKQREYMLAVSGTAQSFRFLGTQSEESLRQLDDAVKKSQDALHGLTHEADALAKKMQSSVWEEMGRAMASGLAVASAGLDEILRKMNAITGKKSALGTVADYFGGVLNENVRREQNADLIAHRTLFQDAQQKQIASFTAKSYLAAHPELGTEGRGPDGKLTKFYNADDLAGLGDHAVSAAGQMHGDSGVGKLTPAQMDLLRTYIKEASDKEYRERTGDTFGHGTGYFSTEMMQGMIEQANQSMDYFAAQEAAAANKTSSSAVVKPSKITHPAITNLPDSETIRKAKALAEKMKRQAEELKRKYQSQFDSYNDDVFSLTHTEEETKIHEAEDQRGEDEKNPLIGAAKAQQRYLLRVKQIHTEVLAKFKDELKDFTRRAFDMTHTETEIKQRDAQDQYDLDKVNPLIGRQKALDLLVAKTKKIMEEDARQRSKNALADVGKATDFLGSMFGPFNDFVAKRSGLQSQAGNIGLSEFDLRRQAINQNYKATREFNPDAAEKIKKDALDRIDNDERNSIARQNAETEKQTQAQLDQASRVKQFQYENNEISYKDYRAFLQEKLAATQGYSEEYMRVFGLMAQAQAHELQKPVAKHVQTLLQMKQNATDILGNGLFNVLDGKSKNFFGDLLKGWEDMLKQMVAKALAMGIVNLLTGGAGGFAGGFLSSLGFDDPISDSKAHHFGYDWMRHFSQGTVEAKSGSTSAVRGTGSEGGSRAASGNTQIIHMHGVVVREEADIARIGEAIAWHTQQRQRVVGT